MPSLFRRKSADLVADATDSVTPSRRRSTPRPKGYTPSKKELGAGHAEAARATQRRVAEPAPANRREAYKQMRERQRAERAEAAAGMRAGDERYLLARDRGPERALVRDIVDSRRTVGTWFFVGALIVLHRLRRPDAAGGAARRPTVLWVLLASRVIVDSVLISRKIKKLVRERFPKTDAADGLALPVRHHARPDLPPDARAEAAGRSSATKI